MKKRHTQDDVSRRGDIYIVSNMYNMHH